MTIGTRLVGTIATLVCMSLMLVGCGGNTSPGASDPPGGTPPPQIASDPSIVVDGQSLALTPGTADPAGPATTAASGAASASITLLGTNLTAQGNAAHLVWSDDGRSVFLADEEGDMSATKIDVTNLNQPTAAATNGQVNYLWAVDQRSGLLVYQPSLAGWTWRFNPSTMQSVWAVYTGGAHEIATDGSRVFVPVEGTPGRLIVLNSSGGQVASVSVADGWAYTYGIAYDAGTNRLYVSSGTSGNIPGGVYIFDVSQPTPVLLGRIPNASSDIAVRGNRLWRQQNASIEAWDVSNAASPTLIGSYTASVYNQAGGTAVVNWFGVMAANAAGTRLYVTYHPVTAVGHNQVLDSPAGFMIFDVSNGTPTPLAQQSWQANGIYYEQPLALALSPDGATVAVSYWAFGVRFYSVANDAITALGKIATTGEAHDVYVDSQGYVYVFAHDDIQIFDPTSGAHIQDIPIVGQVVDGGWRPFRDGYIIVPGPSATIMGLAGGNLRFWQTIAGFGNYTWSVLFDGSKYLYQGDENGIVHIGQVSQNTDGTYTVTPISSIQVPALGSGDNPLLGLALGGSTLWAIGPNAGVVAIDVSNPSAPRIVFQDAFTFSTNGSHAGLVIAQNRVYAGAGALGVRIYDPVALRQTGAIPGFNVNFLDVLGSTYLVVANYWWAAHPDGMYLYNIAQNPDAPLLANWFPQPNGNANFRARAVGSNLIYRVPLYGVDKLQIH